jgi:NAD-dependent dihydropyrimidine dehydrogenase PreA subunit
MVAADRVRPRRHGILGATREFVTDERLCGSSGSERTFRRFQPVGDERRQQMAYVIAQPCIGVKDASCVEVCPVDCIHTTDEAEQYFINPDECIDCGVCAEVCPVEAIFFEDDLPEQWAAFTGLNAAFFKK